MQRVLRAVLAVYAGLLAGPIPALVGLPDWPGFVVAAAVGVSLALASTRGFDEPDRLLTSARVLVGFALPLGWLVVAFQTATSIPTFLFTPWFAGACATLVWFVAILVAAEWRTRRRLDALTELVVFQARKPPTTRRQTKIAAGVVIGISAVGAILAVVGFGDDAGMIYWILPAQIPVWIPMLADSDGREVAIADGGVRIERQFHDWSSFDGYELTDAALTLSRPAWYYAALSFDRTDIEDIEAVTSLLDTHIHRP